MMEGLLAMAVAAALASGCIPVRGDHVLARDLLPAWPALAAADPQTVLSLSPIPGARREFSRADLERLGARWGVAAPDSAGLCVERSTRVLAPEAIAAALRQALAPRQAEIEIQDFSHEPAPDGKLEFPLSGLTGNTQPVLWRGQVTYAEGHIVPVWVRATIRVHLTRLVAVADLLPRQALAPGQVRLEAYDGPPVLAAWAESLADIENRFVRRRIPAGSALALADLEERPVIARGEMVSVEVRSGAARLSFTGRAEADGRVGEWIAIRNLQSGRTFPAQVESAGRVLVRPDVQPSRAAQARSRS